MKKLHLLCNAHIDPVWLWRRNDGIATTLSTFRVAADFCEQYDGFVFNHNEALLYEWVEEYEPALFERIKKLVKSGKWKIMGGWYLQPDCVMTSGESLLSQIDLGREYFLKKFGVEPTTAINFDPFGHTRGLVQILRQKGYNAYLFMRPWKYKGDFLWEGFDGSTVLAHRLYKSYETHNCKTVDKIQGYFTDWGNKETGLCLWGIGNHGGGPSKADLERINAFIPTSDVEIIHSDADSYMKEIDRSTLPVVKESLGPCMVGCYTSMVRIKQANRRIENKLALTEKALTYAGMEAREKLRDAKKALAFCQFHDILPGSAIKPVEDDSLRTFAYAEEMVDVLYDKAFFKLCAGQKKAKNGEIPILVFNPHPYEVEGEFQAEFLLGDINEAEDEYTIAKVYGENGEFLPTQNEKPYATMHRDWTKRIAFHGKLAPSSVTRFDCVLKTVKISELPTKNQNGDYITVQNGRMFASISRKTGLIEKYSVDGKTYIENSARLVMYNDNEDAWGMLVDSFNDFYRAYTLMSDEDANKFCGYPDEPLGNVRIIEDGEVRTVVQAFFECDKNVAIVEYTLPKLGAYVDVNIRLLSNEVSKMTKFVIDTSITGTPYGETAFGYEEMPQENKEAVFHKWCGIRNGDDALYVINIGTYGGSFTESSLSLSLLRTPVYAGHPIGKRQLAPHDRFCDHIDMGERSFAFRITTAKNIAKEAQIFNEAPQTISFFPDGSGEKKGSAITVDNPEIILSSLRKKSGKTEITLYNTTDTAQAAVVDFLNQQLSLTFKKHELKIIEI